MIAKADTHLYTRTSKHDVLIPPSFFIAIPKKMFTLMIAPIPTTKGHSPTSTRRTLGDKCFGCPVGIGKETLIS